ncbi:MAG TPA: L-ribulose-5-phosphate 4-epimerase AraD [Candidatus Acidoferrales bacterium]|jgi:L-ribulose-5-phosphate 4-epimerase|nr:L-ribulose-5-phosphate 4-epimerase AraD [Candidatus Acidoferrales bacterium]
MLEKLKAEVCKANLDLVAEGLVIQTWGNASAVDRERGVMVIKPSGVPYSEMKPQHMVCVSLATGKVVEGKLKPSSDTDTHLILYRAFRGIGGVVHTHSLYATSWAQAGKPLLAYGTTQADYWYGDVPVTRKLTALEIKNDYEANTGDVIVETFKKLKFDPLHHPAVLVASHGPFTWGKDVNDAVHNAGVLEFIARLNSETLRINPKAKPMQSVLLAKHFLRKHGPKATYGQK